VVKAAEENRILIENGDTLVITQKVVSKAEGRIVNLQRIEPSAFARTIADLTKRDPRHVEVILRETGRIIRMKNNHLIVETMHGYEFANAGVDRSNLQNTDEVCLLPEHPDRSAERIRRKIEELTGARIAVIITDTFGRAWRMGQINFAIGISGMKPMRDYRGETDMFSHTLRVTMIAVADELASAAELVMNKSDGIPAAIIKGYKYLPGEGTAAELVRPIEQDLFR
jgi:coenzyme F420-0:L-glutamate ligase/coenzyme F420-1:gamma-L-glutamate ligase